jgi:lipopolysaccharide biosynthesis glycosyltransferase
MNALVTVTSQNYLAGTKVLFQSFLRHNPSLDCEFLVIHDGLSKNFQEELEALFPVKFIQVSDELKQVVKEIAIHLPQYKNKISRFWSIESFNMASYERVLFLDSDILVRGSLDQLFAIEAPFSACPDRSFQNNLSRDKTTFQKVESKDSEGRDVFNRVFNSGVFLINNKRIGPNTYQDLINLLQVDVLKSVTTGHTDQFILNRQFYGRVNWLDTKYNWLLKEAANSKASSQAVIWHYLRHPKPWILRPILNQRIRLEPGSRFVKEWHVTHREVLIKELRKQFKPKTFMRFIYSKLLA